MFELLDCCYCWWWLLRRWVSMFDSDVVRYRAVRYIKAGEVLWTNYGKGFWKSGKRMTNIVLITDQPT